MIHDFTPLSAVAGGVLIGLSASLLLWSHGRIAGISGIWAGLVQSTFARPGGTFARPGGLPGDLAWRALFVAGLLAGGVVLVIVRPTAFGVSSGRPLLAIAAAGLLVGVGTRMSNGCTSGHGVCGLSRFSTRSAVAVVTFMGVGFLTASVIGAVIGSSE